MIELAVKCFHNKNKIVSVVYLEAPPEPNNSSSLTSITVTVGGILLLFFVAMLVMLIVYHLHIKRIVAGNTSVHLGLQRAYVHMHLCM